MPARPFEVAGQFPHTQDPEPMGHSFADWCSIFGLPVGLVALGYAVHQQRRADAEAFRRKNLAAEAQRFLVGFISGVSDPRAIAAINDQLERLKTSL
jgi:hypothetical protein